MILILKNGFALGIIAEIFFLDFFCQEKNWERIARPASFFSDEAR
jgi:hypothetical protein